MWLFGFFKKRKQSVNDEKTAKIGIVGGDERIEASLKKNEERLKQFFSDNDVMISRKIISTGRKSFLYLIAYTDGMVDNQIINESIIKPLMLLNTEETGRLTIDGLISRVLMVNEIKKTDKWSQISDAINYGDTVLFVDGEDEAVILNTKSFDIRSISEPEGEKILSGPREGFSESIITNLSLIRRKIRSSDLKMKMFSFGERTKTKICVCYIKGIVNQKALQELYDRLQKIDIDGVLDSHYFTELIRDKRRSVFRTIGTTERPDVVSAKLLEGRISLFVDGTPVVLTLPYLFVENFQSSEDYYMNYYYTSFSRILRIAAFALTVIVPAYYIAMVGYHREMLPTPFLLNITVERGSVPFPSVIEAFVMLLVFDILRETGIRMPTNIGQALSIVGALVIGQSAVEAKLVSAPMIIVVALTGITSLLVEKMAVAGIFYRYFLLFCGGTMGFVGVTCGICILIIDILKLESFGLSQFGSVKSLKFQNIKDIVFRAPWWNMITRPNGLSEDYVRMKCDGEDGED